MNFPNVSIEAVHFVWLYALIPALALVAWEWFRRRRPRFLGGLRAIWVSGVIFLLADWSMVGSKEYSEPGTLTVFLDRSDSVMRIPERRDREEMFIKEIQAWAAEQHKNVQFRGFAEELGDRDLKGGFKTLLRPALSLSLPPDSPVLVVSDGLWKDRATTNFPVSVVSLGRRDEKDIWIERAPSTLTAFLKNRVVIPVEIGQRGYTGESVKLKLLNGDQTLFEKEVDLKEEINILEIPYFPEKMGESVLELQVEPKESELSSLNNWSSLRLKTVRDKIRILHINGKPGMDLKAWRLFLTRQPDVDLVSFYILRSREDEPQARNDELSLIPFPYEELFTTELDKFDIVILQNFNFSLYFQSFYLSNLSRFVKDGGALLMIGGDQGFQSYQGSPLEEILPVRFDARGGRFIQSDQKVKKVSSHPILQGVEKAFERRVWGDYHELRSKDGDLLQTSSGIPFLSIGNGGRGRVMTLNSDESWHMAMTGEDAPSAFSRFARHALQYLTFDPEMDEQKIEVSPLKLGSKARASISGNENSSWEIYTPRDTTPIQLPLQKSVEFPVKEAGLYRIQLPDLEKVQIVETEEKPWLSEWKNLLRDDKAALELTQISHGRFFEFENRMEFFEKEKFGRQLIASEIQPWVRSRPDLGWAALIALLAIICLDFFSEKISLGQLKD